MNNIALDSIPTSAAMLSHMLGCVARVPFAHPVLGLRRLSASATDQMIDYALLQMKGKHDQAVDVLRSGLSMYPNETGVDCARLLLALARVEADRSNWGAAHDSAQAAQQAVLAGPDPAGHSGLAVHLAAAQLRSATSLVRGADDTAVAEAVSSGLIITGSTTPTSLSSPATAPPPSTPPPSLLPYALSITLSTCHATASWSTAHKAAAQLQPLLLPSLASFTSRTTPSATSPDQQQASSQAMKGSAPTSSSHAVHMASACLALGDWQAALSSPLPPPSFTTAETAAAAAAAGDSTPPLSVGPLSPSTHQASKVNGDGGAGSSPGSQETEGGSSGRDGPGVSAEECYKAAMAFASVPGEHLRADDAGILAELHAAALLGLAQRAMSKPAGKEGWDEAEELLGAGIKAAEGVSGEHHPRLVPLLTCLAHCYSRTARVTFAEGLLRECVRILKLDPQRGLAQALAPSKRLLHPSLTALLAWRYCQLLAALPNRGSEGAAWKLLAESAWLAAGPVAGQQPQLNAGASASIAKVLGAEGQLKGQGGAGSGVLAGLLARRALPLLDRDDLS
ncbi:hypothetical protein QJQ45_002207 [Haematococcus lacustris]|nr:hypothetical protein QJQ45_002207 [Haematococcus lacustris]